MPIDLGLILSILKCNSLFVLPEKQNFPGYSPQQTYLGGLDSYYKLLHGNRIRSIRIVGTPWFRMANFSSRTLSIPWSPPCTCCTNSLGCSSGRTGPIYAFQKHVKCIKTLIHMYIILWLKFIKIKKLKKEKIPSSPHASLGGRTRSLSPQKYSPS